MFFYKTGLVRRVRVHPKYIGGKESILKVARKMAKQDIYENSFTIEHGYIVRLICISSIGKGHCLPIQGFIEFSVTFEAILLYPLVGEVIEAEVEMITDTCITFRYVCVYGVVRSYSLNDEYDFVKGADEDKVPKPVQGSSSADPRKGDMYRRKNTEPGDPENVIAIGTVVRVKIINRTVGGNGFFLIGSMSGEHFGPVKDPPPIQTTEKEPGKKHDFFPTSNPGSSSNSEPISHGLLQEMWSKQPYNPPPVLEMEFESPSSPESVVLPD